MKTLEKVIEGLTICLTGEGVCHCRKCPYMPKHIREDDPFVCSAQLRKDAIAYLTKQKAPNFPDVRKSEEAKKKRIP